MSQASKKKSETSAIVPAAIFIVYVAIGQLIEYERNPRRNDAVVGRMVASIREFGFVIPILATRDGTVIDGHLRLKAARKLGMPKVPVIWCDGWTKAQVKAFRLLANRSSSWAEWDMELLKLEIADLSGLGYDLSLSGFDSAELASLQIGLGTGLTDEDAVPQKPAAPVSQRGDLWHLGWHCHLCGDATAEADVLRLLHTARPMIMIVDPPWGVQYDPAWRTEAARAGNIGLFHPRYAIVNETRRQSTPGIYDEAERVFCARLSQDNRYLGALYVKCLDTFPLRQDERIEITRIASYISIFLANAGTVPQENNGVPPNGDLKTPLIQGVGT